VIGTEIDQTRHESSASRNAPDAAWGPATASVWGYQAVVMAILLILMVAVAFFPCLGNDFVSWDDQENFIDNPHYRGLGWSQIYWAWTSFRIGVYQPLAWMILGAQYILFGLRPWGYHLVSMILYAVDTVVLFVLTVSLLMRCQPGLARRGRWPLILGSGLAVALFAVHPLRVEVVAWVSCQPYLPCALFFMLTVLAYLRAFPEGSSPRWRWLVGAFFLCVGALLSKAVAVSVPAVLLILDVYPLRRLGGGSGRWFGRSVKGVWLEKLPFVGLSLIFMILAVAGRGQAQHSAARPDLGIAARFAQACYSIWFYVIKTFLPLNITVFYPMPGRVLLGDPPFLLSILGTLSVSMVTFLLCRRWPGLLAVWLSYLVVLAPNLGLVGILHHITADRYSYIAMMSGVVLLAAGLCRFLSVAQRLWPVAVSLTAVSLGVLLGLVILTRSQCQIWRTSEDLWTHALNHGASRHFLAHYGLGLALNERNRIDEALVQYREALRRNPNYADAHNNVGVILFGQRRDEEAQAEYTEALRLNPKQGKVHYNLGAILFQQGRIEEAGAEYAEALRLKPDLANAHCGMGMVLFRQGRIEEARAEFAEALRLKPDHADAHNGLGVVLLGQGRIEEAKAEFAEALRLKPDHADAHANLGVVLFRQGRTEEAKARYGEALRLKPDLADAHANLGVVLARQGRIAEAMAEFAEALKLKPDNVEVYNHRAMIWATHPEAKYRDGRRAVESATRACELTGWKDAGILDTLAAATSEAGDFETAVKWQTRAIDLLTDERTKNNFRSRLRLYQARQPYREAIETH